MKTAVSLPDDVFEAAELVAERLGWTRSHLYAQAIEQFVDGQYDDPVTAALDALAGEAPEAPNAGRLAIDAGDWQW